MPTGIYDRTQEHCANIGKALTGRSYLRGPNVGETKEKFITTLIENSPTHRRTIKPKLLKYGILENKCYECGQLPIWNEKKLVLILDHKNGINNDNRPKNLQMLCPNCSSQTVTFAGKNTKKVRFKRSLIYDRSMTQS